MSSPASEIPWETLQRITATWTGRESNLASARPLPGGFVNTTLKLTTRDGGHAVLKITPHRIDRSYEVEAYHLDHLRSLGLPTPLVIQQQTGTLDDPFSYLLMQFVPGVDLATAKLHCDGRSFDLLQRSFGRLVAILHSATGQNYGPLHAEGGQAIAQWHEFFQMIFEPVLRLAFDSGLLSEKYERRCVRIHERLDRLLVHDDVARLVHWDLWSSNVLAAPIDGSDAWQIAAFIDPGCRFAHAEAELAYIQLFETGNKAFFEGYRELHRICPGYHAVRKHVYQLYFLLNHLQLFGSEYLVRVAAAIDRVAGLL